MKFASTNIIKNLVLAFFLIFIDQFSKYMIRSSGGFYVCNPNIAFNIAMPLILLVLFWVVIAIALSFLIFNFKFSNFQIFGLLLILSGAISNLVDRMRFGCVVDFINLKFWPIFNLADVFIAVGAIMLIMENVNLKMKNDKSKCKK